jgi:adenosylcobyric acid synthase
MGVSERAQDCAAALMLDGMPDGAVSADQQVMGTYLYGLFDHPQACQAILQWAGLEALQILDLAALREASINRVADACQRLWDALRRLPD